MYFDHDQKIHHHIFVGMPNPLDNIDQNYTVHILQMNLFCPYRILGNNLHNFSIYKELHEYPLSIHNRRLDHHQAAPNQPGTHYTWWLRHDRGQMFL
jgi:hypothetical protein